MAESLRMDGYEAFEASSAAAALEAMAKTRVDLLVTDLRLGSGMDGFGLLQAALERRPDLPVIIITAYGTVELAVEAMRIGAADFVCKPFKMKNIKAAISQALQRRGHGAGGAADVVPASVPAEASAPHFGLLIGESPEMQRVCEWIGKVAKSDATVLIQGESGTGKELVARAIHRSSRRASGPLVALNCAALPANLLESELFGHAAGAFTGATRRKDGLFIAAHGGTIFLDEISTMDIGMQTKLLRVLQERVVRRVGETEDVPVDVRVIAATNESLEVRKDAGTFREDLFYRICVISFELPPLRYRTGDIPLLVEHFCRKQGELLGQPLSMDPDVLPSLLAYAWPGNVRELENAIACAAAPCHEGRVRASDLPPRIARAAAKGGQPAAIPAAPGTSAGADGADAPKSLHDFLRDKELEYLEQVLRHTGGNRAKAAELLGISRATFYRKLPEECAAPPQEA